MHHTRLRTNTLIRRLRYAQFKGLTYRQFPMFVDRHVLVDNRDQERTQRRGAWRTSAVILRFNGRDYEEAEPAGEPAQFTWMLQAPERGIYRVLACWADGEVRASNARYSIRLGDAEPQRMTMDQRELDSDRPWVAPGGRGRQR